MDNQQLLHELGNAAGGLLLMSETDAPLVPFCWPGASLTPGDVLHFGGHPPDSLIEERGLVPFLGAMCQDQVGDPPDVREMRAGFRRLRTRLPELLADITVFRVGRVRVQAYVAGRAPSGDVAGLQVVQVET